MIYDDMKTHNSKTKTVRKYQGALTTYIFWTLIIFSSVYFSSCRKLIAVDPPVTQLSDTSVYDQMESNSSGLTDGLSSISFLDGLAADELTNYTTGLTNVQFYQNALSSSGVGGAVNYYFWKELYNEIYSCNAVLDGLTNSSGVTPAMKQQLTGEAKFMRAFLYFYAVNLYGDVPLTTTISYTTNAQLSRTPTAQVYKQIIQDLLDAQAALSNNYLDQTGNVTPQKIRPNKWAATALLSRAYLYTGDWKDAQAQSSALISNNTYSLPSDLTQVFKVNSAESILQFYQPNPNYNTYIASYFVLTSAPGTGSFSVAMSPYLINSFEAGDKRLTNWVGTFTSSGKTYYFPYKYKVNLQNQPITEYFMVLRLAEQYLIRAEAESELNDQTDAVNDLNIIRSRAGLPNYAGATNQASLLAAILHERQVELFTEWGHRWFDLIRTNNINSVMGSPGNVCAAKGGVWSPNWTLMPVPLIELQLDRNLTQNPGY